MPEKLLNKMEDQFRTAITMHDVCRNGGFLAGAEWMFGELKPLIDVAARANTAWRVTAFYEQFKQRKELFDELADALQSIGITDTQKGLHYDGDT